MHFQQARHFLVLIETYLVFWILFLGRIWIEHIIADYL